MSDHVAGRPLIGPTDDPPRDGVYRDWAGIQHRPDVVAEGNALGQRIDPDDDEDNGLAGDEAPL